MVVVFLRRGVADPDVYLRNSRPTSLAGIFRPELLHVTPLGALLGLGSHGGYYALTTFLPTSCASPGVTSG